MKLSIITINYNNATGLRKTLDSVSEQIWTDFEHVIVDGGSKDDSVNIMREYTLNNANKYPIKWLSEPDKGVYDAMNKGIRLAIGEYCLFMNGGDCIYSSDTLTQVNLNEYQADLVVGYSIEDQTNRQIRYNLPRLSLLSVMQSGISHQAMFIKRELLEFEGYYSDDLKVLSDLEFLFKCVIHDVSFVNIDKCIAKVEPGGLSNSMIEQINLEVEVIKRVLPHAIREDYQYLLSQKDTYILACNWMNKTKWLYTIHNMVSKILSEFKRKIS